MGRFGARKREVSKSIGSSSGLYRQCLCGGQPQQPCPEVRFERDFPGPMGWERQWEWAVSRALWNNGGFLRERLCGGHRQQSHPEIRLERDVFGPMGRFGNRKWDI